MKEDVRQQRSHEKKRSRARIFDADDAGLVRAPEVTGHDLQSAARRTVIASRIKRDDERRVLLFVHAEHEVLPERRLCERHPLLGHAPEDDARIGCGVDVLQVEDARGEPNVAVHRCIEKRLLRIEVAQHRSRGDPKFGCDIGECRGGESFLRKDAARGAQDLLPADDRRPSHL